MTLLEFLKTETLPNLFLDLDAFDRNCRKIVENSNKKKIRIATKSVRSVKLLQRILQSDPIYQGVMCFTPSEALFLVNKGFHDILIGYPCWDEDEFYRIAKVNQGDTEVVCMVDSLDHVHYLAKIAQKANGMIYVCIDIDMSIKIGGFHFGVRRSPLSRPEEVLEIARKIKELDGVELKGIMGYEAQIAGVSDQMPSQRLQNMAISFMKKKSIIAVKERREEIVKALRSDGFSSLFVNGGGTGSMASTVKEPVVTEITVGSGFYSPLLFDSYKEFRYEPALYFALPIVRKPTTNIYTCLGGGYVASGIPGKDKLPQPVIPEGAKLLALEAAGEVQTPVFFDKYPLHIGDPIIFRASKAGEICERFTEIGCYSAGKLVERYETYRGDGVCFL